MLRGQPLTQRKDIMNENKENVSELEKRNLVEDNVYLRSKLAISKKEIRCLKEAVDKKDQVIQDLREKLQKTDMASSDDDLVSFPMLKEIVNQFSEFYSGELLNFFHDALNQSRHLENTVRLIGAVYSIMVKIVEEYFAKSQMQISKTACSESINAKVLSALRKYYQNTWTYIVSKLTLTVNNEIGNVFEGHGFTQLDSFSPFMEKLNKLIIICHISDPDLRPVLEDLTSVKSYTEFEDTLFDGFARNGQDCFVLMPPIYPGNDHKASILKSLVIPCDFCCGGGINSSRKYF